MSRTGKAESELKGVLERIVYKSDETGFVVARITVQNEPKLITITGTLAGANIGDYLQLKGSWEIHAEHGHQFKVVSYEAEQPVTAAGIIKYLSSSLIKGIGPKTAEKIVSRWGEQSLEIIEKEPYRLTEIEGIGRAKCEMIIKGWLEQKEIKNLMLFLHKYGIRTTIAQKLHKQYGDQAYHVISTNPYKLATDIYGIGFLTADKIALKLGLEALSSQRIEAALMHLLFTAAEEGHCFLRLKQLLDNSVSLLNNTKQSDIEAGGGSPSTEEAVKNELSLMGQRKQVVLVYQAAVINPESVALFPLNDEMMVYHPAYYFAETNSARMLNRIYHGLQKRLSCFATVDWNKAFSWLENNLQGEEGGKIEYSEEQKEAIVQCLTNKITVLTGGPGTGKSTITAALAKLVEAKKKRVLLAAPTGRAAKRLNEVTGCNAQTIHRLLEFSWQNGLQFKRNSDNPLEGDLIIIDETSMLDILLLNHLLKAISEDTHLIFIGDVDQLPSVGAGYVLKDLIDAETYPVMRLKKIFRQSEESSIISNAHRIKEGNMPLFSQVKGDCFFFGASSAEKAANTVVELVTKKIPANFGFDPQTDIQVLAPMHKGMVGITELNRMLQDKLNPFRNEEEQIETGARVFRVNDRIIQLRNNYEKEVFNGDLGFIKALNRELQTLIIEFDSGEDALSVEYEFNELDQITHSYATSIHKSQGSEFPVVVIPLTTQHYIMLQRNLFYTAITRAKKLAVIVGTLPAISLAVGNDKSMLRNTRLAEILREWGTKS